MISDFASESNILKILKQLLRKSCHDWEAAGCEGYFSVIFLFQLTISTLHLQPT